MAYSHQPLDGLWDYVKRGAGWVKDKFTDGRPMPTVPSGGWPQPGAPTVPWTPVPIVPPAPGPYTHPVPYSPIPNSTGYQMPQPQPQQAGLGVDMTTITLIGLGIVLLPRILKKQRRRR